jgi:hypothetical protein
MDTETDYEPVISNWYQHPDKQLHFCIIDIDEQAGVLDIQHADGDLDTMDFDTWCELEMELADEPEQLPASFAGSADDDPDDNRLVGDTHHHWQDPATKHQQQQAAFKNDDEYENLPDAIDEQILLNDGQADAMTFDLAGA